MRPRSNNIFFLRFVFRFVLFTESTDEDPVRVLDARPKPVQPAIVCRVVVSRCSLHFDERLPFQLGQGVRPS